MEPNPVTCEAYSHVRNRGCYHPAKYSVKLPSRSDSGAVTIAVMYVCGVHARAYLKPVSLYSETQR